jgi:hypothetical protein
MHRRSSNPLSFVTLWVAARFPRSSLYVVPDRGHVSSLYFPFRSPEVGVIRRFIASH